MHWGVKIGATLSVVAAALAGCGPRHQFSRLPSPDQTLVATIDYESGTFGLSQDAVVSVQENRGLASLIASFGNVQRIEVSWLGPEDLNICEVGRVVTYKTSVPLNTSKGMRTIHVRYGC